MKHLALIIVFQLTLIIIGFSQNNPPIAGTDTIYVDFNDSISFNQNSGILLNDVDPDGNTILLDSSFYSGAAFFNFTLIAQSSISSIVRVDYKPSLNFIGVDSLRYIIRDNGSPVLYDTATIYLFVKRKVVEQLDLNNINAKIGLASLFSDVKNGKSGFEVPKGAGIHTIFAANLWIVGINQNKMHANVRTYGSFNNPNSLLVFKESSGPIMDSIHYKDSYDYDWDRLWKITSSEIQFHLNNWNAVGYQPTEVIADWPAHGDTTKGQAFYLAPFIDNNSDGMYNPLDGDYPKIKGQQAIYFMYNDIRLQQPNNVTAMRSEVHGMAYVYNCAFDSAINNTVFLDYTIYNRSNLTYEDTYVGLWADMDIGNGGNDYIGSDVDRATFYTYNGLFTDLDVPNAALGYGIDPPAQGVTFLKGAKQDNDGIDNNFGIGANETINGFGFGDGIIDNEHWGMEHFSYYNSFSRFVGEEVPQNIKEYYRYLTSFWTVGNHMTYGGNGSNIVPGGTAGNTSANFMLSGTSDSFSYGTGGVSQLPWSERNVFSNSGGDRRGVGSTGPFTFEPDSSIEITLAFVFGDDTITAPPAFGPGWEYGVEVMQERIDSIRSYFATDFVSVCGGALSIDESNEKENTLLVYPNPFNSELTINYELKEKSATLEIYDAIGKKIMTKTITNTITKINLGNLDKGIYFIQIIDGKYRVQHKIIK